MGVTSNKYGFLIKNITIFAIGAFGSKILTFLIVPFYTYVLSTEDYGNIDLFTTAVSLMLPFTTLVIYEAIIRFLAASEIDENEAISISMLVFLLGVGLAIICIPIYEHLFDDKHYVPCYIVYLIASSYNQIFSQYLRASGKNVAYSLNGVIVTTITIILNLVFLLIFKLGAYGYLYALILAQILASIQATASIHILKHLSYCYIDYKCLKNLLIYCIPIIPNNLMWWIMNAGDKYIINYFMGSGANGIYALSLKIPTLLNLIYSIFMQAWQLSALENTKKEERAEFYGNVFLITAAGLIIVSSLIICIVKPIFENVMGRDFVVAWKYVAFLCIATILGCFATFLGVVYMVNKNSKSIFITTLLGAVINLTLNFMLVSSMGLYGVAIGTAGGYFLVLLLRAKDAKKEIKMDFHIAHIGFAMSILVLQAIALLHIDGYYLYIVELIFLFIIIFIFKTQIKKIFNYSGSKTVK